MRFFSWNVNGFRAALKKGFMDWLEATDPDVLCLQEIRCEWDEIDLSVRKALESAYEVCWFPASSKKGYAGSATLTKHGSAWKHQRGMGIQDYDVEGRIIISRKGSLTLIGGYFPNASTGLARLQYKRTFAKALADCVRAEHTAKNEVILVGDMNVAPQEIDLARPKDNTKNPGFTPEEREDFQGYLSAGLVDILRERNPTVPGLYTWWTQRGGARERNVGWRIDLFLVTQSLAKQIEDTAIHSEIHGSDHCPISLCLKKGDSV
ncbi:MAG: exodeoxyribonuclease III [Holophagales bacterium]|jgi:exodeoxyribonuclease-3|nr:exodeoxyribonuclease III [Holophagales bacterium]